MLDMEALINQAVAEGEIEAGLPLQMVASRNPGVAVSAEMEVTAKSRPPAWSEEEEQFVADNLGYATEAEIAAVLGRSTVAVVLYRRRKLKLPGASLHPDFLTGQAIGRVLGVDSKWPARMIEQGHLPGWVLGDRNFKMIRRDTLYRWAVNPMNWLYFWNSIRDTSRIGDDHLRRLIERQKSRWNDDWWTPGQVAAYHGVRHEDVNRYCHHGRIKSVKWGNRWILRSEATKSGLYFFKGGQGIAQSIDWSEEADVFLIIGRALGVKEEILARMVKWNLRRVCSRLLTLRRRDIIPDLIAKFGLAVDYNPATGVLSANWVDYNYMFPRIVRGRDTSK